MKYFITCYGGGHVAMCIPVIRELQARGHEVTAFALTTAGEAMKRQGIVHKRVIDYVDFKAVEPYGRRLLPRHHTAGKGISEEESIAYLGASFYDLARQMGEQTAWAVYEEKGLNAFCPVEFMKSVLVREKPDAVIATNAPRMEMAALRAAHALSIPSLCMGDLFCLLEAQWMARSDNGDCVTVYSDKVKQLLVRHGRAPESIIVIGNPAFDTLADYAGREVAPAYKQKKHIPAHKKIILWAEQPEPTDSALPGRVREHLRQVCAVHPDWQLLVRMHPSTPGAEMPEGVAQSYAGEPVHEAIAAADAVVTLTSTVGVEALLLDKPVLIIAISMYQELMDYSPDEGALVVESLGETEAALQILLSDSPLGRELAEARKHLPRAGGATRRVCDAIEGLPGVIPPGGGASAARR